MAKRRQAPVLVLRRPAPPWGAADSVPVPGLTPGPGLPGARRQVASCAFLLPRARSRVRPRVSDSGHGHKPLLSGAHTHPRGAEGAPTTARWALVVPSATLDALKRLQPRRAASGSEKRLRGPATAPRPRGKPRSQRLSFPICPRGDKRSRLSLGSVQDSVGTATPARLPPVPSSPGAPRAVRSSPAPPPPPAPQGPAPPRPARPEPLSAARPPLTALRSGSRSRIPTGPAGASPRRLRLSGAASRSRGLSVAAPPQPAGRRLRAAPSHCSPHRPALPRQPRLHALRMPGRAAPWPTQPAGVLAVRQQPEGRGRAARGGAWREGGACGTGS